MIRRLLGLVRHRHATIGARGEAAAAAHLRRAGYRVLAKNVRLPGGEIDLLAETPGRAEVVVVEVKARVVGEAEDRRLPERQITPKKAQALARLAAGVARRRGVEGRAVRIDIVAVEFVEGVRKPRDIRHYENAIDARGRRV